MATTTTDKPNNHNDRYLSVSVVVPVYNDPEGIRTTLSTLIEQTYPRNHHEILVVDNGSTDRTRDVISRYADEHDHIALVVENEVQGSYAARNEGIRTATGDILAFVDADMTVPKKWLESALDEIQTHDADYMGCNVELTLPENPSLTAHYDAHTGFPVKQYVERQKFAPTCCLFVRRDVFEDVGLFDHRLISGGDKEFGNRVADAGYEMHFTENVTMYHPVRESIRTLAKKDFRVGRGHCQLQRYHPDRYGKPGIPPRPSGLKSPDRDLSKLDQVTFGTLSKAMTGVRGLGYYREYIEYLRSLEDDGLPDSHDLELED